MRLFIWPLQGQSSSSSPSSSHLFLILNPLFLSHRDCQRITSHHPFIPAPPNVSQLILNHMNKWWPSRRDCKLVCLLGDELRLRRIKQFCSAEGQHGAHCRPATAHTCAALYTHTHTHTCNSAATPLNPPLSHHKSRLSKLNNIKLD